jgi:CheY-like chemotaxis protein
MNTTLEHKKEPRIERYHGMKRRKVLIVDDEAVFTKMLKMTLELNEGYEICVVNDPRRAVDTAGEFLPDMVILDMVMPELDGPGVHRLFKADSVLRHIPVIFLSGIAPQKQLDEHKGFIGGSLCLAKPVSARTLIDIIEEYVHPLNRKVVPPEWSGEIRWQDWKSLWDKHGLGLLG